MPPFPISVAFERGDLRPEGTHFPALESGQKQKPRPGRFGGGWAIGQGVLRRHYPLGEELDSCLWNMGSIRVALSLQESSPRNSIPQWLRVRPSAENNVLTQFFIFSPG